MENEYRPFEREPDVETPAFDLWKASPEESEGKSALITVDFSAGEEMYEGRLYRSFVPSDYELLILAKKKGDEYWFAIKGKRPTGHTFIKTQVQGPLSLEAYNNKISKIEAGFAIAFDVQHPQITPGKHYNLYLRGAKQK